MVALKGGSRCVSKSRRARLGSSKRSGCSGTGSIVAVRSLSGPETTHDGRTQSRKRGCSSIGVSIGGMGAMFLSRGSKKLPPAITRFHLFLPSNRSRLKKPCSQFVAPFHVHRERALFLLFPVCERRVNLLMPRLFEQRERPMQLCHPSVAERRDGDLDLVFAKLPVGIFFDERLELCGDK